MLDQLAEGQYYTANYLREFGDIASASFGRLFELYHRPNISPQSKEVYQIDSEDLSTVFQVVNKNHEMFAVTGEFNTNQTGFIAIPSPGAGKRIVVQYGSLRTESNSGTMYAYDSVSLQQSFKIYLSVQSSFASANLWLPLKENAALLLTTTQGAKPAFYSFGYHIEVIKAQKV